MVHVSFARISDDAVQVRRYEAVLVNHGAATELKGCVCLRVSARLQICSGCGTPQQSLSVGGPVNSFVFPSLGLLLFSDRSSSK